MKILKINTINLLIYNIISLISVIISIVMTFVFLYLFELEFYISMIVAIILCFFLVNTFENKAIKTIKIGLDNDSLLIISDNREIMLEDIIKYKIRYYSQNFPYVIIYLKNKETVKIRSSEKGGEINELFEFLKKNVVKKN